MILAVIGVAIGVMGFGVAVWAWLNPRSSVGVLDVTDHVVPLHVPEELSSLTGFRMFYDDAEVSEPYVCTIRVTNVGSTEVVYTPSVSQLFRLTVMANDFIANGAVFLVSAPEDQIQPPDHERQLSESVLEKDSPSTAQPQNGLLEETGREGRGMMIPLQEFILKRGASLEWTVFSEGKPRVASCGSVIGTEIRANGYREWPSLERSKWKAWSFTFWPVVPGAVLSAALAQWGHTALAEASYRAPSGPSEWLFIVLAGTLGAILSMAVWIRFLDKLNGL